MARRWKIHEWTTVEQERFRVEVDALRARHRAQGCKVFDEILAKCTCIRGSENDNYEETP